MSDEGNGNRFQRYCEVTVIGKATHVIQLLPPVAHEQDLQRLLHRNSPSKIAVVHQELRQIEQIPRLHPSFIRNAALVHDQELVPGNLGVQVVVHFPDEEFDLALVGAVAKAAEGVGDLGAVEIVRISSRMMNVKRIEARR